MPIVTGARLNRFLSDPKWTAGQTDEAEQLCAEVEATLADKLSTYITPVPYVETQVAVLDSGLVATRHPVAAVTELNGVAVTSLAPLPTTWALQEGYLRWVDADSSPVDSSSLGALGLGSWGGPAARTSSASGSVALRYMAGWGDEDALRLAILRKVGVIFLNRHDDSVMARNLDTQQPAPLPSEEWTDLELAPLGRYRNGAAMAWK